MTLRGTCAGGLLTSLLSPIAQAGGSYADVWARDTATFITIAAQVNPPQVCQKVLRPALARAPRGR